jgi:hypothetical protein
VEVAADAVWALFAAHLLRAEPIVIAHACKAIGITPSDLREARQRRRDGGVPVLSRRRPQRAGGPAGPAPVPVSPPSSRAEEPEPPSPEQARRRPPRPSPEEDPEQLPPQPSDRCCRACRQWLPKEKFYGDEPTCRRCRRNRRRELRITKVNALNAARVSFVVDRRDVALTRLVCMDCGLPLRPGEAVHLTSSLRHVDCPATGIPDRRRRQFERVS